MKYKFITIIFLAVSLSVAAFEGTVKYKLNSKAYSGANFEIQWYIKGDLLKMKLTFKDSKSSAFNHFLPEISAGKIYTWTEGMDYYNTLNIPANNNSASKILKVEDLGQTEMVGNILCKKYNVVTSSSQTVISVASDWGGNFWKFASFFPASIEFQALLNARIPGFVVKSTTTDLSGNVIESWENVEVNQSKVADNEFIIPSGLTAVEKLKSATKKN